MGQFNDWGGGGNVTYLSPFWEGTARTPWSNAMNSGQACRPCRGSCSLIPGRGCFGDLPGDEIVVSPPSPIVEPLMCVSACCCTAAVVHLHDPMTKGRGGCRECQSPVHCGTPLPDVDTFRGTGRCRTSQLYRYVCTVQTGGHFLSPRPTLYLAVSHHREHDIDRFLATPFLIVLLLLSAISYGSFFFFQKPKA